MDDSFLQALFPARHRILGRRMQPYCYGHVVTLHAIGSPLVADTDAGAEIDAGQFLAALQVCAAPGFPLLRPDQLRPRWRDVLQRMWLERDPARLRRAVDAFRAYRDDHGSFPQFYEKENLDPDSDSMPPPARYLTAPVALARVCGLIRGTSLTWSDAWRMPVDLLPWITGTFNEMEGGVRFSYASDRESVDDLPDLNELSEAELYRLAVQQLGKERAAEWRRARRATQRREKRQQSARRRRQPTEGHDHGA